MLSLKSRIPICWLVFFPLVLFSNQFAWGNSEDSEAPATLTVSAEGVLQFPPDKALVGLAVETAGESLEKVQTDNRQRMQRVLARMKELEIPENRIQTSSLNIIPRYPPRPRRPTGSSAEFEVPKIVGYTVKNALTVEVHKLDRVGRVVEGALEAGANRFSHVTWGLIDQQPARLNALKVAAQQASEKATTLAQALNVKLVRILDVTEGAAHVIPRERRFAQARMSMGTEDAGSIPLSPGELNIRATVSLVFEISSQ